MTASCPAPEELLRAALADANAPRDETVMRHVRACAACQETLRQLRETTDALRLSARQPDAGPSGCLDDDAVAAFAEGSVAPTGSTPEVAHLLACPRCRERVASVARMLGDADIAEEVRRLAPRPAARARPLRTAGAIAAVAAAAALLVVVARPGTPHRGAAPTYREQSPTGAMPPVPLAPVGAVRSADSLRWRPVPRADRYRLTVFDHDGSVRWEGQTTDTVVALPRALAEPSDATYLWRVEAHVGWEDRWVASELIEFSVRHAP